MSDETVWVVYWDTDDSSCVEAAFGTQAAAEAYAADKNAAAGRERYLVAAVPFAPGAGRSGVTSELDSALPCLDVPDPD
jgi:hypothetical protein